MHILNNWVRLERKAAADRWWREEAMAGFTNGPGRGDPSKLEATLRSPFRCFTPDCSRQCANCGCGCQRARCAMRSSRLQVCRRAGAFISNASCRRGRTQKRAPAATCGPSVECLHRRTGVCAMMCRLAVCFDCHAPDSFRKTMAARLGIGI